MLLRFICIPTVEFPNLAISLPLRRMSKGLRKREFPFFALGPLPFALRPMPYASCLTPVTVKTATPSPRPASASPAASCRPPPPCRRRRSGHRRCTGSRRVVRRDVVGPDDPGDHHELVLGVDREHAAALDDEGLPLGSTHHAGADAALEAAVAVRLALALERAVRGPAQGVPGNVALVGIALTNSVIPAVVDVWRLRPCWRCSRPRSSRRRRWSRCRRCCGPCGP